MLRFIPGKPALLAGDSLVLGDLHIGLEHELFGNGLRVGSQAQFMLGQIQEMIAEYSPESVVILGDVKHNVPDTPLEETRDLYQFIKELCAKAKVHIAPGNHDGGIGRMLAGLGAEISPSGGFSLGEFGFFHGHAWPRDEAMSQETIIMAHQHPLVEFVDGVGGRHARKAWCIGGFSKTAQEKYSCLKEGAKAVIVPAFNPLVGGAVLNKSPQEGLQGPLLNNKFFKLEQSKIYLLDGTPLGSVSMLIAKGPKRRD